MPETQEANLPPLDGEDPLLCREDSKQIPRHGQLDPDYDTGYGCADPPHIHKRFRRKAQ